MGTEQQNNPIKKFFKIEEGTSSNINITDHLAEPMLCPFCQKKFNSQTTYNSFNIHIKKCGISAIEIDKACDMFPPSQDISLNKTIFQYSNKYSVYTNEKKVFGDFNSKVEELKNTVKSIKVSWQDGFCQLNLNRQNFLLESVKQIEKVDLHKELKINFIGEVSYDAGGIIREWFTTIFQTLEGEKLKLFLVSDSKDFSYIINPFLFHNDENFKYFTFIGKLLAKALIDNITVNLCFNKLIYKMILQENITFDDLVFIDNPLYNSLKNLKSEASNKDNNYNFYNINNILDDDLNSIIKNGNDQSNILKDLSLFYSIEMKDVNQHLHSLELIENGRNIPVSDISDYINKRINFMIGIYEPFIKKIRDELYKFFPKEIITNFTSDEFELVLNGRPFIDVEEWKMYTEYKAPYNQYHNVILWYWDVVSNLSQKELSNLLLFSTGSSRVPLGGFSVLESNRGNIAKFTIEYIPYVRGVKNFIKAHTCFNRLDLPCFMSKKEVEEALKFVSSNEILGFGID